MHVRRLGIIAALAVFALGLAPSGAPAQTFTKPVRIIVPFAPGGTSDILARLIGPKLQDAIGQPVVVENKTGAGGNIGADLVAKAEKDGHTLLLIDVSTLAISPNLLASMTYSPSKDLAPIGLILFAPYVLAVHPSLPVKTIPELVAHAKANAGKVPFGNAGSASPITSPPCSWRRTGAWRSSTCRIGAAPMPSRARSRARAR